MVFRFNTPEDTAWFEQTIDKTIEEYVEADLSEVLNTEPYFVDFLRDEPEPTGEEPEDVELLAPKVYEEVFHFTNQILGTKVFL